MPRIALEHCTQRVEDACTRVELSPSTWLEQIAIAMRPMLDLDGLGIAGGFYECPDPCSLRPTLVIGHGLSAALASVLMRGVSSMSPAYVAATFLGSGIGPGSYHHDWSTIEPVHDGSLARLGVADTCAIRFADLDGSGLWFISFRKQRFEPTRREWQAFARARRHVATAYCMRRRLAGGQLRVEGADVAFDRRGRVIHRSQDSVDPALLEQLSAHARARDPRSARELSMRAADDDPRWLATAHEEPDGREYLLAHRVVPVAPNLALLSAREREVLTLTARGCTAKAIAYDLGLAHSTVRVLLARAAAKLGAKTRDELLQRAGDVAVLSSASG